MLDFFSKVKRPLPNYKDYCCLAATAPEVDSDACSSRFGTC